MRDGFAVSVGFIGAASVALVALLGACSDEADEELPPVGLATHIDKLLADPSPLPSQRSDLPAAATPDVPPAAQQDLAAVGAHGTDQVDASPPPAAKPDTPQTAADSAPAAAPPPPKPPRAGEPRKKAPTRRPATRKRPRSKTATKRASVARRSRPPKASRRPSPPPPMPAPPAGASPPPGLDATDLYHLGDQQLRQGKYSAAISSLAASHKMRPSKRTLTKLGQAYFDAQQLKKAENVLRRAGTHAPAMLMLGTLYQQTGQQSRARKVYKAFLTKYPNHKRATWVRTILQAL